jgi:hypothetical protein
MKPALFYVLGRRYGRPTLDSLMAVTSVKGGQLYGRDAVHGNPTHRRADDMVHAFRTLEDAQSVIKLAQDAYDAHQDAVDKAEALRREAIRLQGEAVKRAGWDKTMTFQAVMDHLWQKGMVSGPGTTERLGRRMAHAT